MNQCIVLGDTTDWQARAVQAEAVALTLQTQRDAAEADVLALRAAAEIVRSEYNSLLGGPLPDVYATMQYLRWPVGHLALTAEMSHAGAPLLADLEAVRAALQKQRDAAEAETAQALEALTIARDGRRIFEADAAALMDALGAIGHMARHADGLSLQAIDAYSRRVLACDRSTALLVELEAARAVVVAARNYLSRETSLLPIDKSDVDAIGALLGAVRAYDEATKRAR